MADIIFVMEKRHRQRLEERFSDFLTGKRLIVLDIPDVYTYMDEDLIQVLEQAVHPYLP